VRGFALLAFVAVLGIQGCDGVSRRGDTTGIQTLGRWEWHGRLVFEADPRVTLMRLRIDTTGAGPRGNDVVLTRFDVDPTPGIGDEYALTIGLDLGRVRELRQGIDYPIGPPPARIRAHATIICLCEPLREDSTRGTLLLATRGMRQLTGRLDATVYFTEWNNPARRTTFVVHQRFDAIK
jgi:hypothetical protein